jgi:hypothetical protein
MLKPIIKQKGAVLIIFAVIFAVAAMAFFVSQLDAAGEEIDRDKRTVAALAEAKAALIGHAVGVNLLGARRPGDLPCPDNYPLGDINEGNSTAPCNANALGRLPWKTLGISDLRDGNGERLWYAVSTTFKNSTRTTCTSMGQPGCLNSDTNGTITVRDTSGTIINNGTNSSAAIAVVIASGSPLQRQDGLVQNRSVANYNIASHYLDNITAGEDNSNFADNSTNGFINGIIKDASQQVIVNDRLIVISQNDLMPLLEKRVANEVLYCLKDYALTNPGGINRHPWSTNGAGAYTSFADSADDRFGRIPDITFSSTEASSASLMNDTWTGNCKIASLSGWWLNWKELVFYAVGWDRDPSNSFPAPACDNDVANDCLTIVTPTGNQTNKGVAVMVAGRALATLGQVRISNANKQTLSNYLEDNNANSTVVTRNPAGEDAFFEQKAATTTFNDVVVYY